MLHMCPDCLTVSHTVKKRIAIDGSRAQTMTEENLIKSWVKKQTIQPKNNLYDLKNTFYLVLLSLWTLKQMIFGVYCLIFSGVIKKMYKKCWVAFTLMIVCNIFCNCKFLPDKPWSILLYLTLRLYLVFWWTVPGKLINMQRSVNRGAGFTSCWSSDG